MIWNSKHLDERVKNLQNKIYKEIYVMVIIVCIISIVYKFTTMEMSLQNVTTEWLIILITSIYYFIRSAFLGIFTDEVELHDSMHKVKLSTKYIILGVAMGMFFAIILGINSAFNYADSTQEAIYFFFLVFFVSLFMYALFFAGFLMLMYAAAKKKSDKVVQHILEEKDSEW